ncbi:MAG: GEVED domain-containing protein, partial [Planctomycetaceae bacterium]
MLSRIRKQRNVRATKSRSRQTATESLEERLLLTINFNFDYRYDNSDFFDTAAKKQVLELAGEIIGSQIEDNLDAINASGSNNWRAIFPRPDNGNTVEISNPTIAENELLVFVGARALDGPVGNGGFGGFWASGSSAFRNTVDFRGQSGESSGSDHGPWGGQLTFNTSTNYHFGETVEGLENDETDFLSVALHEISHLLGFGLSDSYETHVTGSGKFEGPKAVAEYDGSGDVPLAGSTTHIASSITDEGREAALDPGVLRGERKLLTKLDWAVLADIGWEVETGILKDWGDAPNSTFPTRSSNNGARHTLGSGLELGVTADPDDDGQSGSSSTGDDNDEFDDDDGVVFSDDYLQAGTTTTIDVTASATGGKLDAWIDFNGDGDWADSGEQIFDTQSLSRGENTLTFAVPEGVKEGTTYARFRLSSAGGLNFNGPADDGEVEDYKLTIIGEIAAMNDTFGDEGTLDVLDNDLPANQGKILSFEQPGEGSVSNNFDGTLEFDGGSGFSGTTSFSYTVGFKQDKDAGSSTQAGDEFGSTVAISGDLAIVGA